MNLTRKFIRRIFRLISVQILWAFPSGRAFATRFPAKKREELKQWLNP